MENPAITPQTHDRAPESTLSGAARSARCPHCGGTRIGEIKTRAMFRCKDCRKQIADAMNVPFNCLSPRFTELKDAGLIRDNEIGVIDWDGEDHGALTITEAGRIALAATPKERAHGKSAL